MLIIDDYFELLLPPCAYIRGACREEMPRRSVGAGIFLPRAPVALTAVHRAHRPALTSEPAAAFLCGMFAQRTDRLWARWAACGQLQPVTGHHGERV